MLLAPVPWHCAGTGHSFIVFLGGGWYPVSVLNSVKAVPEVCHLFCATANPTAVVVASDVGGGQRGVIGGSRPLGFEDERGRQARRDFQRSTGYKR
jgi:adenosine/AMP kinase